MVKGVHVATKRTFQNTRAPPKKIPHHALALPKVPQIRQIQTALRPLIVFREDILERLRLEAPLVIVRRAVAAVLVLVHARRVDAEEGVGEEPRHRRVGQVAVDQERGEDGERDVPAEAAAAKVGVARPDDAVAVLVPVVDVLDYDLGLVGG